MQSKCQKQIYAEFLKKLDFLPKIAADHGKSFVNTCFFHSEGSQYVTKNVRIV